MARASSLPQHLRYLQPFQRKFHSRPEELNEDSGPSVLMPLLSKRVNGLQLEDAENLLEQDLRALQDWLSDPIQENDPLQFVLGFFLVASPAEIAKLIKEEAESPPTPKLCLRMELPPGAKRRRPAGLGEEGMVVSWRGLLFALGAAPEQAVISLADASAKPTFQCEVPVCSSVHFDQVTGRKFVAKGESWRGPFKQVSYALTVPGGHVFGSVSALGKNVDELNWDETSLEAYFHTLRVVTEVPQSL